MHIAFRGLISLLPLIALAVSIDACSTFDNCENRRDCGPYQAGDAGNGGEGAQPIVGGSSGMAGSFSEGGSKSGGGAGSGGEPCSAKCPAERPICDASSDTCVECLRGDQCGAPKQVCKPDTKTCVECTTPAHCLDHRRLCDPENNVCVRCLEHSDCNGSTASQCVAGECKPCVTDEHCLHVEGKSICSEGECVQCTGTNYASCGKDEESGKSLVCDSLKRTCTNAAVESAGDCQPCIADAQCKPGQLCILQQFGVPAKDVGYFCMWKEGVEGGKANCLPDARPYVKSIPGANSIDGVTANVCGLRTTTCVALSQFSAKDCTSGGKADDSLCGFAPGIDSKCVKLGGTNLCTMPCLSYYDCKGPANVNDAACDTGAEPDICRL